MHDAGYKQYNNTEKKVNIVCRKALKLCIRVDKCHVTCALSGSLSVRAMSDLAVEFQRYAPTALSV